MVKLVVRTIANLKVYWVHSKSSHQHETFPWNEKSQYIHFSSPTNRSLGMLKGRTDRESSLRVPQEHMVEYSNME